MESGDPAEGPLGAAHLGELSHWLGDEAGARRYYSRTLETTDQPDLVAEAAYRLGEMARRAGDHAGARELLERPRGTADPEFAPRAETLLAEP
jgi:hypothetical protein